MTDSDAIRDGIDLTDYVAGDLGQSPEISGGWAAFYCPFHGDVKTPDLKVNISKQYITCFSAGCPSGLSGGSVFDYVAVRKGLNVKTQFREIAELLSDKTPLGKVEKHRPRKPPKKRAVDFMSRVQRLVVNIDKSRPYFASRGIDRVEPRLMTLDEGEYGFVRHQYTTLEEIPVFPYELQTPRYIIPHVAYGKVNAVNTRRDDEACKKLMVIYEGLLPAIRIDVAERRLARLVKAYGVGDSRVPLFEELMPSDKELMDIIFNAKYMMWSGSRIRLYNRSRISHEDFSPKSWTSLCVAEGEVTASSLEDITSEAGFAAVGAKSFKGLDIAFGGVGKLWLLGENDSARKDPKTGNAFNASQKHMEAVLLACGRFKDHTATIIKPPKQLGGQHINDFNDFIQIDRKAAIRYLTDRGVPLISRERLAIT